jgi:DNA repair protein RecO (recombination protein O)
VTPRHERHYRTEALVIRRQDLGEADRLLTLYTPTAGKLRVIAKGARRPSSRKAGHLELFIHSMLLVAVGRNLDIVTQAETIHSFRALREDLERITFAHYVIELLDRFTSEGQENRPTFDLVVATLQRLCDSANPLCAVRLYELRLLALEGYQPQLFRCLGCGEPIQRIVNYLDPAQGGVLCPRCGEGLLAGKARQVRPVSVNALKVLRYMQTHDDEASACLRLSPETHRDLESLMVHYITYILERELKSVEFLHLLRREQAERG